MTKIAPYWKAVIAFFAPAATLVIIAVTESSPGGSSITSGEWITALATCIVTSAAVYSKSNGPVDPS